MIKRKLIWYSILFRAIMYGLRIGADLRDRLQLEFCIIVCARAYKIDSIRRGIRLTIILKEFELLTQKDNG